MTFDFEALKDILVCPQSRSPLVFEGDRLVSVDPETRLSYPVRDDIPIMLVDEATPLAEDEWKQVMLRHGRDPLTGEVSESRRGPQATGSADDNPAEEPAEGEPKSGDSGPPES